MMDLARQALVLAPQAQRGVGVEPGRNGM